MAILTNRELRHKISSRLHRVMASFYQNKAQIFTLERERERERETEREREVLRLTYVNGENDLLYYGYVNSENETGWPLLPLHSYHGLSYTSCELLD